MEGDLQQRPYFDPPRPVRTGRHLATFDQHPLQVPTGPVGALSPGHSM